MHPILKFGLESYFSKPRTYSYKGVKTWVQPEVFPPHLTFSTKLLLNFLTPQNIQGKTFLELGCGSGIISLYAAHKGASVTATDINEIALNSLKKSTQKNHLNIEILHSDLFENLQNRNFDYIFINPPYYPKAPKSTKEHAWFCGENFDYFKHLFYQLPSYITKNTLVIMILSEDCDLSTIKKIAMKNSLQFQLKEEKKVWQEKNYIFKINKLA